MTPGEHLEKFKMDIQGIEDLSKYIPDKLGFSEEERRAAHFVFWLIYLIEDSLRQNLNKVKPTNYDENTFHELTLGDKLRKIIKECKEEGSYEENKKFFNISKEINIIRNDVVHQNKRIKDIFYNGKSIIKRETQVQMIVDFGLSIGGEDNERDNS